MNTTKAEKEYRILTDTEFLNDKKYKIEGCYSDYDSTFNQTLHFHDFYELSIIYEGESGFLINGVALTMSVGGSATVFRRRSIEERSGRNRKRSSRTANR